MKDYTWKNKKYVWLSVLILLGIWTITAKFIDKEVIIPSPQSVLISLVDLLSSKNFNKIVFSTLSRSFISFLICILSSIILGVLAGMTKTFYNIMMPFVALLKSVPTMAIVILALIWLNSEKAPILIGIVLVFPVLYDSVVNGVINVDKKLIQMAELYSVKKKYIIKDIYMPSIYAYLSSAMGAALGLTLKAVIAGEVLGQPKYSIGGSMQLEKMYLNTSGVFAWIVVIVALVTIFEMIIKILFTKKAFKNKV